MSFMIFVNSFTEITESKADALITFISSLVIGGKLLLIIRGYKI